MPGLRSEKLFVVAKGETRFGRDGRRWHATVPEALNSQERELFDTVKRSPYGELDHEDDLSVLLSNNSPDVNILYYGQSPLFIACNTGKIGVVKMLLRWPHLKPIDVDAPSDSGETPFLAACRGGYLGIVKALLANQANPNLKAADGRSPLWEASKNGRVALLQYLLDHVSATAIDWETTTPGLKGYDPPRSTSCIDVAKVYGHTKAVPILEIGRQRARQKRARHRLKQSFQGARTVVRLRDAEGTFFVPDGMRAGSMGRETRELGDDAGIDFGNTRANYDKMVRRISRQETISPPDIPLNSLK